MHTKSASSLACSVVVFPALEPSTVQSPKLLAFVAATSAVHVEQIVLVRAAESGATSSKPTLVSQLAIRARASS